MLVIFNELGALESFDKEGDLLNQGAVGIVLKAQFKNIKNTDYIASINYTRSDGSKSSKLLMNLDAENENGYIFNFDNEWYFALDGETTFTIFLYDSSEKIIANGQAQFYITKTDYDSSEPTITTEQYDTLLSTLKQKINYIDIVDSLGSVETAKPLSANMGRELDVRLGKVETGKANASETNERFASAELRLDNLENSKVDKINNLDDNNPYVLYGAEFNDTQTIQKTYPISEDAIERTIARRGLSGELSVGDPTLENSATNKKYVNELLNLYVKYSNIDTDFSLTSTNPIQNKVISKQIKDINYTIMVMKEELFETVLSEIDYKVDYATIYPIPETLSDDDGTHRVVYSDTQLKEVEGNSVAFNQMINGLTNVSIGGGTATIDSDNVITYTLTNVGNDISTNRLYSTNPDNIQNHTYLVKFSVKCSHTTPIRIFINGYYVIGTHEGNNQWQDFYAIRTAGNNNSNNSIYFECQSSNGYVVGDTIQVRYWNKFDLTLMFGAGNEPTTVAEFNRIFPNEYYPYNAGEIKSTVIKGVRVRNSKLATVPLNKINVVDLGTLNWTYISAQNLFFVERTNLPNNFKQDTTNGVNILCSKYYAKALGSIVDENNNVLLGFDNYNDQFLAIKTTDYTSATDFKTAMSGVMLYYECVEPQETISQQIVNEFVTKTIQIPQTELLSAGSVHDTIKFVEGNIVAGQQRYDMVYVSRIGDYTFTGSETWNYLGTVDRPFFWTGYPSSMSDAKKGVEIKALTPNGIVMDINPSNIRIYLNNNPQLSSSSNMNTVFSNGKVINYEKAEPTETTLATDLTFEEVSAIIEQGGSIETVFEIVPPNLKTAFVVNKAIVS